MMSSFFSNPTPEQKVRQWTRLLRSEQRKMDQQINRIQRDEQRVKNSMKQAAGKGDQVALRMLAKELVRSRKATNRMYLSKTQMNSIALQLQHQLVQIKMMGSIQKSRDITREMNSLIRVKEIQKNMMELNREMMKNGIIESTTNDALDIVLDDDIEDADLEVEVNKVVDEVVQNKMQDVAPVRNIAPQQRISEAGENVIEDEEDETNSLDAQIAALRNAEASL